MMRSINMLVFRNLTEARLRTVLSVLVVVLGVSMMVASDGFANAIRDSFADNDQAQTMGNSILNLTGIMLFTVNIVIMLAAGFLIFNAFLMSVTERRQQIGMLRSLGMTRKQIMQMILGEGLLVGLSGVLLGLIVGPLLGEGLRLLLSSIGASVFSTTGSISFSFSAIVQAVVLGLVITLVAVLLPGWSAARTSPLSALRPQAAGLMERSSRRRALVAAMIILVLLFYLYFAPPGKWVTSPIDIQLSGLFILLWLACLVALLPMLIEATGRFARGILSRRWKVTGRLVADNLERERQRVSLTVLTMAVGMTMIISMSGVMQFLFHTLLLDVLAARSERSAFVIVPFNLDAGMAAFSQLDLDMPAEFLSDIETQLEGKADVLTIRIAMIPEVNPALSSASFTYVLDPHELQHTGDLIFTFTEGNWDTALPLMESGCGLLVGPSVANKYQAGIGDIITAQGLNGPVDCTIAGIGTAIGWATIINNEAIGLFDVSNPFEVLVTPRIGVSDAEVENILRQASSPFSNIYIESIGRVVSAIGGIVDSTTAALNSMLVLAVIAAALGVINTTMISVHERHRELGLIRAVGATRAQLSAIVMGEAALMGLVGAFLGILGGIGMTIIFVVTFGGNGVGLTDLALWPTALRVIQPALLTGLVGLIVAPLISAFSAWLPTRELLQGTTMETLNRT